MDYQHSGVGIISSEMGLIPKSAVWFLKVVNSGN
jgi:hypothetical protein